MIMGSTKELSILCLPMAAMIAALAYIGAEMFSLYPAVEWLEVAIVAVATSIPAGMLIANWWVELIDRPWRDRRAAMFRDAREATRKVAPLLLLAAMAFSTPMFVIATAATAGAYYWLGKLERDARMDVPATTADA